MIRQQAADTSKVVKKHVHEHVDMAKEKTRVISAKIARAATDTQAKTKAMVSDKEVQATAASAAGGAVVLGTGGAATGLVAGGVVGAAVGLVPAVFTFGLSIPVMAVVGGACGLTAGAAAGGTTGAIAGAGGYKAYAKREDIVKGAESLQQNARERARALSNRVRGGAPN